MWHFMFSHCFTCLLILALNFCNKVKGLKMEQSINIISFYHRPHFCTSHFTKLCPVYQNLLFCTTFCHRHVLLNKNAAQSKGIFQQNVLNSSAHVSRWVTKLLTKYVLTHKHLEMHECILSTVAPDVFLALIRPSLSTLSIKYLL